MKESIKKKFDSIDQSKIKVESTKELLGKLEKGLNSKTQENVDKAEALLDKFIAQAKAKNADIFVSNKPAPTLTPTAKKKANQVVKSKLDSLMDTIANDPLLKDFNNSRRTKGGGKSDPLIDSERKAIQSGPRVSKQGWKNQYGKSTGGRKYYEYRENRIDRKAPNYGSRPWLKEGGFIHPSDANADKYVVVEIKADGSRREHNNFGDLETARMFASLKREFLPKGSQLMIEDKNGKNLYRSFKSGGFMADEDKIWEIVYIDKGVQKSILVEGYSDIVETNNWKNKNPTKQFVQIRLYDNKIADGGELTEKDYEMAFAPRYLDGQDFEKISDNINKEYLAKDRKSAVHDKFTKYWYNGGREKAMAKYGDNENQAWEEAYEDFKEDFYKMAKGGMMADGGSLLKSGYFAYPSGDGGDELGVFYDKQSMINFAVANKDKYGKLIFEGIEDGDILEVNKDDSKDVITWLFSRIGMNTKEANKKIKMWFISNYPEEEEQIDERVTFDDIWFDLKNQRNIYYALGNRFVIREVFEKIATIYGVEYDFIEKMYKRESYAKGGQIDESTAMVLSQNKAIAHHTEELKKAISKNEKVEPWVIGKMQRATTDMSDVTHYFDGMTEYAKGGRLSMKSKYNSVSEYANYAENGDLVLVGKDEADLSWIGDTHLDKVVKVDDNGDVIFKRFGRKGLITYPNNYSVIVVNRKYANGGMMADGGKVRWQDVYVGDNALVIAENKMGMVVKPYGRRFHLKFPDGSEKTYSAEELEFFKDEEYAKGGQVGDFFYDSRKDKAFQVIFEDGDKMGLQYLGMDKKPVGGVTTITKNEFEYNVEKGSWGKWKQDYAKGGEVGDFFYDSRKDKAFQVIFEDGDKMGLQYLGMDKKPVGGVTTITKNEFEYNVEKGSWGKWKQEYAKGGEMGFEKLSDKVAKNYVGDKVKPKYQKEYGKTYDKTEAKEVGNKVASKVYRQQLDKMEHGGKLPEDMGRYFIKTSKTKVVNMSDLIPLRKRATGIANAEKNMKMAYDGEMDKRKPITIYKSQRKYRIMDGNSTYAVAKANGWETIWAEIVKNPNMKNGLKRTDDIFSRAKSIRKEGEAWKDALQRAKAMK